MTRSGPLQVPSWQLAHPSTTALKSPTVGAEARLNASTRSRYATASASNGGFRSSGAVGQLQRIRSCWASRRTGLWFSTRCRARRRSSVKRRIHQANSLWPLGLMSLSMRFPGLPGTPSGRGVAAEQGSPARSRGVRRLGSVLESQPISRNRAQAAPDRREARTGQRG